jgi:ubiquinone/menaquinone biosynthesis C-methylase UbiE
MTDASSKEIVRHYSGVDEQSRLSTGWFQLEYERTQELIRRRLRPAPAAVLDVGGGAGVYACWLAALGYIVHLIDPVPKHIDLARAASARQPKHPLASIKLGDARKLEQADNSVDAVLLLGPLYHLTERSDRLTALREAHRVLRPEGCVWVAAISRFASLLDSLTSGFFSDPEFAPILDQDLADGQHRNPTTNPVYFTDAFFHRPEELTGELGDAGFRLWEIVGVEGPGWLARDFERLWKDREQRDRLLDSIRRVEREPALLGASAHLLAIGRK